MRLALRSNNRDARLTCRALGFEDAGTAPGYYRGRESAVRMQLNFRQTELGFKP